MGFRSTGNDIVLRGLTTAHRRAIVNAGESVEDGSLRYWAPSKPARDIAELYKVAWRAEDYSLCMILTEYGRYLRQELMWQKSLHAPGCQLLVNSSERPVGCSCRLIRPPWEKFDG